tara:strand:+ start:670 stop:1464 length:795 start_codon:yes stop_codon:yes gene_type:complete
MKLPLNIINEEPSTLSLDLPEAIESLLTMPTAASNDTALGEMPRTGVAATDPNYAALDFRMQGQAIPSAQAGGEMPSAGLQTGQPMPASPTNPTMLNNQIDQSIGQNPEVIARIRAAIEAGLQTGEITTQELNMMVELAKTVMQNPAMYPQIRQLAIEQGLATDADLPPEYDEGLLIAILMVGKSLEADVQLGPSEPTMPQGGMLEGPSHDQGGIPVKSNGGLLEMEGGEYVIPKNVVKAKGTEFFDRMIKQYEEGGEVKKDKY